MAAWVSEQDPVNGNDAYEAKVMGRVERTTDKLIQDLWNISDRLEDTLPVGE